MRTLFVLGTLMLVAGSVSTADTAATVQKTLQADYDARDKAVARRDIQATLADYAPDFVGVSAGGKTHDLKEERADFLQTFALPAQSSTTQTVIQKMTLDKTSAEADVTLHRHGVLRFTNPQTRVSTVLTLDGVYLDRWERRANLWLLIREQSVSVQAVMNGKPL